MAPRTPLLGLTPQEVRERLGEDFAQSMPSHTQQAFDVDVLVLDIEGDAYSLRVAERHVVILKRTAVWARQNFSLAHELAHIAAGDFTVPGAQCDPAGESAANAFAAELLMPASEVEDIGWEDLDGPGLAEVVWRWGVSTEAVRTRLRALGKTIPPELDELLDLNTFALLRQHWTGRTRQPDPITARRELASTRLMPLDLASRLESKVAAGTAPVESLAFVLDVAPEDLEAEVPELDTYDDDLDLLRELSGE